MTQVDAGATDDTNFRCELGVRKANGTVIGLSKMTSHFCKTFANLNTSQISFLLLLAKDTEIDHCKCQLETKVVYSKESLQPRTFLFHSRFQAQL